MFNKIKDNIKNIEYIVDDKKIMSFHKEINEPFYLILECLLKIVFNEEMTNNIKDENYHNYINDLKIIYDIAKKLDNNYKLNVNHIYLIEDFLEIENVMHNFDLCKEGAKQIINYLIQINEKKENDDELSQKIKDLCEFLRNSVKEENIVNKLIIKILLNQFKKIEYNENNKVFKSILEIILSNNELIKNSIDFIFIIFKDFVSSKENLIIDKTNSLRNAKNEILDIIEENNNPIFEEVIIYFFEKTFFLYFLLYENEKVNLELLKLSLEYLEGNSLKDNNQKFNKINLLYSLAYFRLYLNKIITEIYSNYNKRMKGEKYNTKSYLNIIEIVNGNANNNFRKMLQLYIYKLIYNLHGRNIEIFKGLNLNHIYDLNEKYYTDFYQKHNKKEEFTLEYFLIPEKKKDLEIFNEQISIFKKQYQNSFETGEILQFQTNIKQNGIDIFYIISCNFILSNIYKQDYIKQGDSPFIFYNGFANNILNILKEDTFCLLNLFISRDKIINMKNFQYINGNKDVLEKLLYSMRFCLQFSIGQRLEEENENNNINEKSLYGALLSDKIIETINNNYFPGNEIPENDLLKTYEQLIEHFKKRNQNDGAYICECGHYYYIPAPGTFNLKDNCYKCKKKIEIERFFRVVKNKIVNTQINCITLDEFYDKYIKNIYQNEKYGILKVSKKHFENIDKKIRGISQISYRILSFILFSHLLFAEELKYIQNQDYQKYLPERINNFVDIINKNWDILEIELKKKNINNIRIFLNLIFKDIVELIKNKNTLKTIQERNDLENDLK